MCPRHRAEIFYELLIEIIIREKWLSPVIQANGRQEQWDGLRRKGLTVSTDGFLGPHYGRLHDRGVYGALQSQLTKQAWCYCFPQKGESSSPRRALQPI
jgi:hypothetical protein